MLNSLPERPLHRSEIDKLNENARVDIVSPVYSNEKGTDGGDIAAAIVLAYNGTMNALAFKQSGWEIIEKSNYGGMDVEGLPFEATDEIQRMQDVAMNAVELD